MRKKEKAENPLIKKKIICIYACTHSSAFCFNNPNTTLIRAQLNSSSNNKFHIFFKLYKNVKSKVQVDMNGKQEISLKKDSRRNLKIDYFPMV